MFDLLLAFPNETAAMAAYGPPPNGGVPPGPSWRWGFTAEHMAGAAAVTPVTIHLHHPALDAVDPETGATIRGVVSPPGFWIGLATTDAATRAEAEARPEWRVTMARPNAPTPWRQCIAGHAPDFDAGALTLIGITAFAGSGYLTD